MLSINDEVVQLEQSVNTTTESPRDQPVRDPRILLIPIWLSKETGQ